MNKGPKGSFDFFPRKFVIFVPNLEFVQVFWFLVFGNLNKFIVNVPNETKVQSRTGRLD